MSIKTEDLRRLAPYYKVIRSKAPYLSGVEAEAAARVLQDLEEDPNNCKDYKSVAIAINTVK